MKFSTAKSGAATWREARRPLSGEQQARLFKKIDAGGRRYTTVLLHAPGETTRGQTAKPWRGLTPPKGRHWRSTPEVLEELHQRVLIEWLRSGVPRRKFTSTISRGRSGRHLGVQVPQHPDYPTEKNFDMLKMIVEASSNAGDVVLDCFCGSGTTLVAASESGRKWIGIDESGGRY